MTLKRTLVDQTPLSTKKARTTLEEEDADFSIVQWTRSSMCWACDNENDVEQCIRTDWKPEEYFNVAAILLNPSQLSLYPESGKMEQLLRSSAGTLNVEDAHTILDKIHAFIHHYSSKEIVESIDFTLESYVCHKNREAAFVVDIINWLKNNLNSEVVRRIKENDTESLKDILFLNPRLARLVSLLALTVKENKSVSPAASFVATISDDIEEEQVLRNSDEDVEYSSSFSVIDTTTALSNSELSIENDDSYLILPVPSQPIPDSQTVENTLTSSQACDLFTQPSFSIYENSELSETSTPPPPNYDELSTDEIRAKVRSYGFKPAHRSVMISYLEQLRLCARPDQPSPTPESTSNSSAQDADPQDTRSRIIQYLRSEESLWMKIVKYEQLDLDELYKKMDIPCKKSDLKSILDEYGAIVKKAVRANKKS